MDRQLILKMIENYVVDGSVSERNFENVFSMLKEKERDEVAEILAENGILIQEPEEIEEIMSDEDENAFEILYDNSIFVAKEVDSSSNGTGEDAYNAIKEDHTLSNEGLIKLIHNGSKQAREDFLRRNIGLVYKYVNQMFPIYRHTLGMDDLVQAGLMGMMKAIDKFNPELGNSFTTYATYWIKQSIAREICDNGFTIRIPVHKLEAIHKVRRTENKLMDISDSEQRIKAIAEETGLKEENVRECIRLRYEYLRPTSLDAEIGDDPEGSRLIDFISDERQLSPEELAIKEAVKDELYAVLNQLGKKEKEIILFRYGFIGYKSETLEQVGNRYHVTRERIRQIEKKAIEKLVKSERIKQLKKEFNQ